MTGRAAETSTAPWGWTALSGRLSPYLDPVLGLLAAVLAVVSLLGTDLAAIDPRLAPADPLSVGATAVAGLSLTWRRSRPVTSFTTFVGACLLVTLTDHYIGLLSVLLLLSLYSLAVHGRRRDGVGGLGLCLLVFVVLALLDVPDLGTADLLQACALLVTAWAVGDALRSRRAQQAQRLRVAEQEAATAREQTARAVAEERLRIARELHDVVAHSMALIAVQAGVGGHVIHQDAAAAERALEVIADTSRRALTQTRAMLGLLRDDTVSAGAAGAAGAPGAPGTPADPPAPTVAELGALVDDVRHAGLEVTLTVTGAERPLDPGTGLTAYRVVQESLTNVLKHSSATRAEVLLTYDQESLEVDVRDPGDGGRERVAGAAPADGPGGGRGLLGLDERVRLVGGSVHHGPLAEGPGFRVTAHLPTSPAVVP